MSAASLRAEWTPRFSRALSVPGVYLANHSLGRTPDATAQRVAEALDLWYRDQDRAWDGWTAQIGSFRAQVARLLGWPQADAVVPKTSAGQGLRAVLNALPDDGSLRPVRIVATAAEFDSLDFILRTYVAKGRAEVAWVAANGSEGSVPTFDADAIADSIQPGTDLVVVPQVFFQTGQVLPLAPIVTRAHAVGAKVLVDTYHSAGVLPLALHELGVDFAVGGCYKYLRGGPGACFLAVHPRWLGLRTLDTGWFAKREPFAYQRPEPPEFGEGGDGWLESTPPVLTAYQSAEGLALTLDAGVDQLRAASLELLEGLRHALLSKGVPVFVPSDPHGWGAFALVPTRDPQSAVEALRLAGVTVDARGSYVRFGPDVLNSIDQFEVAADAWPGPRNP